MKKIVFFLFLLFSLTSQAQNKFPSVDSLQNYTYRYVKNSSVESFTNLRLQNILIGLSQMVDTLRNAGYVDSIWIGADDTLKYRIGNTTFKVGKISGGGSSYSFTYPLQLNTGIVSLDTTKWHSFPFYNTQYRPITWVPTLQEVTTQGRRTTDSIVFVANNENTQIGAIYQTSTGPDKRFLTYQTGSTLNSAYTQLTPSNLTWVTTGDNTLSITTPLSSPTDNRTIRLPDTSGVITIGAKVNGTTYMAGANGIVDLGTVTTDISGKLNISDTSSMLSPYLPSNVAAATYQPIGSYLTTATLTDSLPNAVSSITLNTPNVVFTTPVTFSKTGRAWSGTLALNNQSANRVFAGPTTGSAAAPTFRNLDTADFGGNFYSQVRGVAGVDSGWTDYSSTSTVTGWSSFTNKIIRYAVIGNIVHVHFFILGTSNSTTTSFTLPISISSNLIATEIEVPCRIFNNGTPALGFFRNENSTTIGAYSTITGSSWTASGTKLISGDFYYEKD